MPLASSNKTGRKKSKLWKAQYVEFYSNQGRWVGYVSNFKGV